jgi:hypothetical protein
MAFNQQRDKHLIPRHKEIWPKSSNAEKSVSTSSNSAICLAPTILNPTHHMTPFYIYVVQILRFAQNSDLMEHYFD